MEPISLGGTIGRNSGVPVVDHVTSGLADEPADRDVAAAPANRTAPCDEALCLSCANLTAIHDLMHRAVRHDTYNVLHAPYNRRKAAAPDLRQRQPEFFRELTPASARTSLGAIDSQPVGFQIRRVVIGVLEEDAMQIEIDFLAGELRRHLHLSFIWLMPIRTIPSTPAVIHAAGKDQ